MAPERWSLANGRAGGERAARLALVAAALASTTGCAMIPRYERPAAPVAARFPGETETPTDRAAADLSWRTFFAEERLAALVALAIDENRDLRVATLRVEQSRAQYRISRASSYPELAASGSFVRQHAAGITTSQWSAGVGVTAYELDLFGRVRSQREQALEQYFATEEGQRNARIAVVAEVATQYFSVRQAEEQAELARQTLAVARESHQLTKILFDAGATSELDVRTAEGQVETTLVSLLAYELQRGLAENALVLVVGRPLPSDLPPSRRLGAAGVLAEVPSGLPSDLVQRRPDILQAEHTLRAANANVGAARAAFFPSISLTGSLGSASAELSGLFGGGSGTWSFMPQISVPIFAGGRNQATLDAARVGTLIEVANYEKAIQTAFREVADALVATRSHADRVDAEGRAIAAQRRRLDIASARYRQGEASYLDVLSAERDLYAAEQGILQAQLDLRTNQIALYKALGGGWK